MPTLGDLAKWFFKSFGQGVAHKYATDTRGPNYLQQEQEFSSGMKDREVQRTVLLSKLEQEKRGRSAQASVARSAMPFPEGTSDEEAMARYEASQSQQARELEAEKIRAAIESSQALAGQREGSNELKMQIAQLAADMKAGAGGGRPAFGRDQWVTGPDGRPAILTRGGGLVSDVGGQPIGMPPTADQRNMERYDIMMPAQMDAIQSALDEVKQRGSGMKGYVFNPIEGATVRAQYSRLVEGLAATAARAMGDNRISDTDRAVYARMYGVANQLVGLPPTAELAQRLLTQTRALMESVGQARAAAKRPGQPLPLQDSQADSSGTIQNSDLTQVTSRKQLDEVPFGEVFNYQGRQCTKVRVNGKAMIDCP